MISADKIDMKALKEAVTALNDSGILEEKIKMIGVGKETLAANFGEAIDGLSDEQAAELPESVVDQYNVLFADEVAPEKKEEKPAKPAKEGKPAKEEKPAKPAKEAKPPKESKPRATIEKVMLCGAESSTGKIETALKSKQGISAEEATAIRPGWKKMLHEWKKAGFNIELIDGRYYCK